MTLLLKCLNHNQVVQPCFHLRCGSVVWVLWAAGQIVYSPNLNIGAVSQLSGLWWCEKYKNNLVCWTPHPNVLADYTHLCACWHHDSNSKSTCPNKDICGREALLDCLLFLSVLQLKYLTSSRVIPVFLLHVYSYIHTVFNKLKFPHRVNTFF